MKFLILLLPIFAISLSACNTNNDNSARMNGQGYPIEEAENYPPDEIESYPLYEIEGTGINMQGIENAGKVRVKGDKIILY